MRVAVVGAGFYGLHLASVLLKLGLEVVIFERSSRILNGASGNNQFRLHLGFHYPRNFRTRQQSRDGFFKFVDYYGDLTRQVDNNYYLVPSGDSCIDFPTYKSIMMSSGIDFIETSCPDEINHPCGCIKTDERVLLIEKTREYFQARLCDSILLGAEVTVVPKGDRVFVGDGEFDFCIDCTWGHLSHDEKFYFEATLLLYYQQKPEFKCNKAFTFVDGPLCSLYPTENSRIYTLSSVVHTPLFKSDKPSDALRALNNISHVEIQSRKTLMENQLIKYYPNFLDHYEYLSPQLSLKTKPKGADDDRSCYVTSDGRVVRCLSGKIDNIFYAANEVISILGAI